MTLYTFRHFWVLFSLFFINKIVISKTQELGACGTFKTRNRSKRVVGGSDYTIKQAPWSVQFNGGTRKNPYDDVCGASIISGKWCVTVAHCISGSVSPRYSRVIAGVSSINEKTVKFINKWYGNGSGSVKSVDSLHPHPYYDDLRTYNDVGLIKLKFGLKFNDNVRPICLPKPEMCLKTGSKVTITGWGATKCKGKKCDDIAVKLQGAVIPVYSSDKCKKRYSSEKRAGKYYSQVQTCAGDGFSGVDGCDGDSGSGLFYKDSEGAILWGMNSWSNLPCGKHGYPGVYTRVPKFVDWISKVSGVYPPGLKKLKRSKSCGDDETRGLHSDVIVEEVDENSGSGDDPIGTFSDIFDF